MPTPVNRMHYDRPLTDMSVAYIQSQEKFVARKVFPQVTTEFQSDVYYVWDKDDYMRDEAQERAPNTEAAETTAKPATEPFLCKEYALKEPIPWQRRDNADKVLDMEGAAMRRISQKLLIRQDRLWTERYFKAGVWATDLTGVTSTPSAGQFLKWTEVGSTPVQDIDAVKDAIEEETGYRPNKMVISPAILTVLKHHPDILDRIKYSERGIVTIDLLKALFDLDELHVARGVFNASKKGEATQERSFIIDNGVLLAYAADAPGIETPSAGYTFAWQDIDSGAGEYGGGFRRYSVEARKSDFIEGEFCLDFRVVGKDLGAFMANVI